MPDNIQIAYSSEGTAIFTSRASFNAPVVLTGLASFASVRATGQIEGPAGSAILPSFTFTSDVSRGFYRSAASTIAITSGVTFNWRPGAVKWSWDTRANATGMSIGELAIVFQASGISLMYSSGVSSYVIGQSSQSVAQA